MPLMNVLHKNGIEFPQQLNGNISFNLTSQENDVRRRTVLDKLFAIFTPVWAADEAQ